MEVAVQRSDMAFDKEESKEREYWNRHLSSRLNKRSFDYIAKKLLAFSSVINGVGLELGCGEGRLVDRLPMAFGIDYSMISLRIAKNRKLPLAQADATKLPFDDGKFDYIVTNSLHHMPHMIVLEEVYRLLKPGGYFFCFEPNRWHLFNLFFSKRYGVKIIGDRGYFPEEISKILYKNSLIPKRFSFVAISMERVRLLSVIQKIADVIPSRFFRAWFFLIAQKR